MVAYVHIEYSSYQFSEESKGGGWNPPPSGPCGTEKSVVLRGVTDSLEDSRLLFFLWLAHLHKDIYIIITYNSELGLNYLCSCGSSFLFVHILYYSFKPYQI